MNLDSGSESWDPTLNPQLRGLQVIIVALVAGAMSFLLITVFMSPSIGVAEKLSADETPLLLYVAVAGIFVAIAARATIPALIEKAGRSTLAAEPTTHPGTPADRSDLETSLMALYQRRQIVAVALIEAPTFLLGVTFLIYRDRLSLVLALAMIAWMAVHFPLQKRVALWLTQRRGMVEDERRLAPL